MYVYVYITLITNLFSFFFLFSFVLFLKTLDLPCESIDNKQKGHSSPDGSENSHGKVFS